MFPLLGDSDMRVLLLRYKIFDKALKRIQDDSQVSELTLTFCVLYVFVSHLYLPLGLMASC